MAIRLPPGSPLPLPFKCVPATWGRSSDLSALKYDVVLFHRILLSKYNFLDSVACRPCVIYSPKCPKSENNSYLGVFLFN